MIVVLMVASGAAWEPEALRLLGERTGVVVLKRCVDVPDLLAAAASGQAQVAVLGLDTPGLDVAAVDHLRRHSVRPVAVVDAAAGDPQAEAARMRATRIGLTTLVPTGDLASLPDVVAEVQAATERAAPLPVADEPTAPGRVVVVWGPAGAPGRSTVAAAVGAELGRRGRRTVLVDADPYGGTLAQQLGILDEVSGVLAASRFAASGELGDRFAQVQRGIDAQLSVVSGLPRADRWSEVRSGTVERLLEVGRGQADLVVDTGFSLEEDLAHDVGGRPARNQQTREAVEAADELLVVGAADPIGLSRLARALGEVREVVAGAPVRVVVNRMRSTLGWSEHDIAGMVAGLTRLTGLHFLPDDRAAVDRALVAGRTLVEGGESALTRAVAALVDDLAPSSRAGRVRTRTAGTARRR